MLTVDYRGGLGNCLFQHAFGRLVADQFGMKFISPKIPMFPDLVTELSGFEYEHGTITVEQESKHPVVLSPCDVETRCRGFNIVLRGFFEAACHYIEHRERIRTWFQLREASKNKERIAIHIRGTDAEAWRCPPDSYYYKAIEVLGAKNGYDIYSDDQRIAFELASKITNVRVFSSLYPGEDFLAITQHDKIIIGNSTFAWWAAFLSRATMVIQPEPINGWRSPEYPNSCLRVPEWVGVKYENPKEVTSVGDGKL